MDSQQTISKSIDITKKSTRVLSVVQSSRGINADLDNVDVGSPKLLFQRQSRSRSVITSSVSFQIAPTPMTRLAAGKSGYDLRFELPSEEVDKQKGKKMKSSYFGKPVLSAPNHINRTAVEFSLLQKTCVTNAADWQGEGFLDVDSLSSSSDGKVTDQKATVIYGGDLKYHGQTQTIHVPKPPERQTVVSIFVNAPSSEGSQSSVLWSWPWLDRSERAEDLFKRINSEDKGIENIPGPFGKLPCPLQAFVFLRYLQSVQPCVSETQFKQTEKLVKEFALNHGKEFQDILFEIVSNNDNWLEKALPNCNYCYSYEEAPLTNLGIIAPFCHDVWPEQDNSLVNRACQIVKFASEFWQLIRTNNIKTISDEEGNALDMSQFRHLFSSVKLPGLPASAPCSFFKTASEGDTPRHIIVIHRGRMFTMYIADENFNLLPLEEIKNTIKEIMLYACKTTDNPVSMLTSTSLDTWTTLRQFIAQQSENNEVNLMEIEQAIFVLSLDHKNVRGLDMLVNESLFADGCNRWFDKGLNIYVYQNGLVTLNVNRTILDGPTVAHLLYYMHLRIVEEVEKWDDDATNIDSAVDLPDKHLSNTENAEQRLYDLEKSTTSTDRGVRLNSLTATEARALYFDVNEFIQLEIEDSARLFKLMSSALLTATYKNDTFNAQFFSQHEINKDAFAHMVLHLTFFKMYFRIGAVGSKVCLKKFIGANYDTMRSSSPEMAKWCRAVLDPESTDDQRQRLFWSAEKKHRKLLRECFNGQGCDNSINALNNLTDEHPLPLGNMFEDASFDAAGYGDRCEINAESLGVGCTSCPVVPPAIQTGYGVGYSIANSFIFFTVTTWEREVSTNADLFAASLQCNIANIFSDVTRWYSPKASRVTYKRSSRASESFSV